MVGEVGDGDVATHEEVPVGQPAHLAGRGIGLVGDLSDDLLDDVLDGDDPGNATILVDDDRQGGALALQIGEEVVEGLGLGHDRRVVHNRLEGGAGSVVHQAARERTGVHEPAHAVAILAFGDDEPGVAGGDAELQRGLDVTGDVDGDDGGAGGHHLAGLLLMQVEDAGEHPRLAGVEVAAGVGLGDQALELIGGAAAGLVAHVDSEHLEDPRGDCGDRADDGAEEDAEPLQGAGDAASDALGAVDGVELGDHLPEDRAARR